MVARRGLGLITSSNFFVPQVNVPGSMASFVTPAAIPISAIAANGGKTGLRWLHRRGLGQDDSTVYAPANLTATWSDATTGKALGPDASGTIWDLETGKPVVSAVPSRAEPTFSAERFTMCRTIIPAADGRTPLRI
jgi:hypothetical protein